MRPLANQSHAFCRTISGLPKKNAVFRAASSDQSSGSVIKYQNANTLPSSSAWYSASLLAESGLRITFEHFLFHRLPDFGVQLNEPWRHADFRNVARPRQVDRKLADRAGGRARGKHDHAIGQRDRFFEIVGDEND